jgi:predicted nucleotidyltransferase
MITPSGFAIPVDEIAAFCEKHHIRKLALFGSVLRDDFRDDSDIDVLVEFEPDAHPGWEIVSMQDELSELLGRQVDLGTFNGLSKYIRKPVMRSAQIIYEQT